MGWCCNSYFPYPPFFCWKLGCLFSTLSDSRMECAKLWKPFGLNSGRVQIAGILTDQPTQCWFSKMSKILPFLHHLHPATLSADKTSTKSLPLSVCRFQIVNLHFLVASTANMRSKWTGWALNSQACTLQTIAGTASYSGSTGRWLYWRGRQAWLSSDICEEVTRLASGHGIGCANWYMHLLQSAYTQVCNKGVSYMVS